MIGMIGQAQDLPLREISNNLGVGVPLVGTLIEMIVVFSPLILKRAGTRPTPTNAKMPCLNTIPIVITAVQSDW